MDSARSSRALGLLCAAFASAIGVIVLLGWILGSDSLKALFYGDLLAKTNTGIGLVCLGLALMCLSPDHRPPWRTWTGYALAALAAAIGLATLTEHLTGLDVGIDQLLFREEFGAVGTVSPNRMGPPASFLFPVL